MHCVESLGEGSSCAFAGWELHLIGGSSWVNDMRVMVWCRRMVGDLCCSFFLKAKAPYHQNLSLGTESSCVSTAMKENNSGSVE